MLTGRRNTNFTPYISAKCFTYNQNEVKLKWEKGLSLVLGHVDNRHPDNLITKSLQTAPEKQVIPNHLIVNKNAKINQNDLRSATYKFAQHIYKIGY